MSVCLSVCSQTPRFLEIDPYNHIYSESTGYEELNFISKGRLPPEGVGNNLPPIVGFWRWTLLKV